jgi:hypothetical protein
MVTAHLLLTALHAFNSCRLFVLSFTRLGFSHCALYRSCSQQVTALQSLSCPMMIRNQHQTRARSKLLMMLMLILQTLLLQKLAVKARCVCNVHLHYDRCNSNYHCTVLYCDVE